MVIAQTRYWFYFVLSAVFTNHHKKNHDLSRGICSFVIKLPIPLFKLEYKYIYNNFKKKLFIMGMKKSNMMALMTMGFGLMAMSDYDDGTGRGTNPLTAKDIEDINRAKSESIKRKKIQKLIKQGCKRFVYYKSDGKGGEKMIEIYARNKRNADRKAKNKCCMV